MQLPMVSLFYWLRKELLYPNPSGWATPDSKALGRRVRPGPP